MTEGTDPGPIGTNEGAPGALGEGAATGGPAGAADPETDGAAGAPPPAASWAYPGQLLNTAQMIKKGTKNLDTKTPLKKKSKCLNPNAKLRYFSINV